MLRGFSQRYPRFGLLLESITQTLDRGGRRELPRSTLRVPTSSPSLTSLFGYVRIRGSGVFSLPCQYLVASLSTLERPISLAHDRTLPEVGSLQPLVEAADF